MSKRQIIHKKSHFFSRDEWEIFKREFKYQRTWNAIFIIVFWVLAIFIIFDQNQ